MAVYCLGTAEHVSLSSINIVQLSEGTVYVHKQYTLTSFLISSPTTSLHTIALPDIQTNCSASPIYLTENGTWANTQRQILPLTEITVHLCLLILNSQ